MVAYSFKRRFVDPIKAGLGHAPSRYYLTMPKRQTIRADRKRHARPGEELQLYCGMRTKGCFLIGRARCIDVQSIRLRRLDRLVKIGDRPQLRRLFELDAFARADGFADWHDLTEFWRDEHAGQNFVGVIIFWEPIP